VWLASAESASPALAALLDAGERDRWRSFRRPRDRATYLVAHALLRVVAGAQLGVPPGAVALDAVCPSCGAPHGRPRLPGTKVYVSLSHSDGLAAVAVTTAGEVGVDVERVAPWDDTLDSEVLTPAERRAVLAASDRDRAFTALWTRKEALLKATGTGLLVPPAAVGAAAPGRAHVADVDAGPGYAGAVVVLGTVTGVTRRDADPALRAVRG
jgi:4'-phosphopantetheinyl transferase